MHTAFQSLTPGQRESPVAEDFPAWRAPMLATLVDEASSRENWIYERKLDGVRCLVYCHAGQVQLYSRNQNEMNAAFPELVSAFERQSKTDYVVDGEIVAFDGQVSSFSRLQNRIHIQDPEKARAVGVDVFLYVFDVLHLDGYDCTELHQRSRKELVRTLFNYADPIRFLPHRNTDGEAYFAEACQKGWEGIIAKDGEAKYVGSRSRSWQKFKCVAQQELVIGGFTEPQGSRIGFGALLVGYYQNGDFNYAGKVGTGFDDDTLRELHQQMAAIEQDAPAFREADDLPNRDVHWVRPELVAEIGFDEWTEAGKLRQPRYLGLRKDKAAEDVVRERGDG